MGEIEGVDRRGETIRPTQGGEDGDPHVIGRELGEQGAIGEFHHGVDQALRMDDDFDPVFGDVEEVMGLDDLQALVHQGRRIDRDLRAHPPGGVGEGVVDGGPLAMRERDQVRKGPPEAVRIRRSNMASMERHLRVCWRAKCSLSTGRRWTPVLGISAMTRSPAMTRASLLARAMSLPARMAATVGVSPTEPDESRHHHVGLRVAGRPLEPVGAETNSISGNSDLRTSAPPDRASETRDGRCSTICSARRLVLDPAAKAETWNRSGWNQRLRGSRCRWIRLNRGSRVDFIQSDRRPGDSRGSGVRRRGGCRSDRGNPRVPGSGTRSP